MELKVTTASELELKVTTAFKMVVKVTTASKPELRVTTASELELKVTTAFKMELKVTTASKLELKVTTAFKMELKVTTALEHALIFFRFLFFISFICRTEHVYGREMRQGTVYFELCPDMINLSTRSFTPSPKPFAQLYRVCPSSARSFHFHFIKQ